MAFPYSDSSGAQGAYGVKGSADIRSGLRNYTQQFDEHRVAVTDTRLPSTVVASTTDTLCPFGQIINFTEDSTEKTAIRGGVVYAGDKVWNVDPQELNLNADGEFLVWLEIGVTANTADGVLLPGINTSTAPVWNQGSLSSGYPDKSVPEADPGTGTAIIALGILKIEEGSATFIRTGCGNLRVTHCPGSLGHLRVA
jgi:hypothetical protein